MDYHPRFQDQLAPLAASPLAGQLLYPQKQEDAEFWIVCRRAEEECGDALVGLEARNLLTDESAEDLLHFLHHFRDIACSSIVFSSYSETINPALAEELQVKIHHQQHRRLKLHCAAAHFTTPSHLAAVGRLIRCSRLRVENLDRHNLAEALR